MLAVLDAGSAQVLQVVSNVFPKTTSNLMEITGASAKMDTF